MFKFLFLLSVLTMGWSAASVAAFSLSPPTVRSPSLSHAKPSSSTSLAMNYNQDEAFRRFDRASRSADANDNVVELLRPLGLVLDQYDNGDVYVKQIAPKGNAARTGKVKEGDIVTMCSATFGDQMWSTRGVGLSRVLAAIRVRSGPTVRLVFESPNAYKRKKRSNDERAASQERGGASCAGKKGFLIERIGTDRTKIEEEKLLWIVLNE